ncbi:TY-Chap2 family putative peptide chaperone [Subtercola endophyticus]|uniref:TY-Chap2 family putative peptide chaperone n=1 Tax=Subtercola endophyticus TaxID=2895559 RepID=UPI001E5EEC91|nr:hypothetical protein [Subtercola endophyticus]UFS57642.1 hypothetical protein LQ955_11280 [Subtercola endophyticus]
MRAEDFALADRFIDAQMWSVGSELVRRHPWLWLQQCEDPVIGDGLLIKAQWDDGYSVTLGRNLGIDISGPNTFGIVDWAETLTDESPGLVVDHIDEMTGWARTRQREMLTRRSLAFDVIEKVMTLSSTNKSRWTVRNADPERYGLETDPKPYDFSPYPTALAAILGRDFGTEITRLCRRYSNYWFVFSDDIDVAVIDERGYLHTRREGLDLLQMNQDFRGDRAKSAAFAVNMI